MEFLVKSGNPSKQRCGCIIIPIFDGKKMSAAASEIDLASEGFVANVLRRGDIDGKVGQTLLLYSVPGIESDRVLLIGCGKEREITYAVYRKIVAAAIQNAIGLGAVDATSYLTDINIKSMSLSHKIIDQVLTISGALYTCNDYKSKKPSNKQKLKKFTFNVPTRADLSKGEQAVNVGSSVAKGMSLTKDLGNAPGNVCTPTYLADKAKALAKQHKSVKASILEEDEMRKMGMGSLLSVSVGSDQPPKLIVMEYSGGKKSEKPIALVGKGVTFDSGGISLKPGAGMDEMKYDMCGAASVFGTLAAIADMQLPINVVCVVPSVENMPSGRATKPGDVVTSLSGQTIEILNTDAEGRLILCDALTYTADKFQPTAIVDIATLTGACIIALGHHASGLCSNTPALANDLLHAGKEIGDVAWELPLLDEYQEQLRSNFADFANIGGRPAGTITAACFLSRFTKKQKWAHLDIAGTAWVSGERKGATGRPVPLLCQFLMSRAGIDLS